MSDSAIKLFGKTIPLQPLFCQQRDVVFSSANVPSSGVAAPPAAEAKHESFDDNATASCQTMSEKVQEGNMESPTPRKESSNDDKQEDRTSNQNNEDSKDPTTSPKTSSNEGETSSPKSSSKNGEQSETSVSQEKTLKKPDKILPCPRCNSMDTKFCYYNNYNVNQPRHFCKNCQRYWTAGGTMRNVPVGAGRRKNKSSSASHYRHLMVPEALRTAQVHGVNGVHNPSLVSNGTVLTFGTDSPLCESVASVLSLADKSQSNYHGNGYHRPDQRVFASRGGAMENGDDCSSGSCIMANSNSSEKGNNSGPEAVGKNHQGFPPQVPCFPGHPWPYPWNSAMPPQSFSPSGFPVSFFPAAPTYWGCTVPSPWNLQPCFPQSAPISSPTSPLGKHSRDGTIINPAKADEPSRESNSSERNVLVPKTLRIDDPREAARSSIWATLGLNNEKSNSTNGGGLFKGFQSKNEDRSYMSETSALLQANPAALSRSLNFHERT